MGLLDRGKGSVMTNELTLENIRSGAFPSDAHAVGFLLGEIKRLTGQLNFANREPPHCPSCDCGSHEPEKPL
jgi:hypothetical protein